MVSDQQVKRLWRVAPKLSLEVAAAKAGMDAKTARKYLRARRLPSEMQQKHTWRNRPDAFADFWDELAERLQVDPGLQAKTLFEYLQEREPGRFQEGQLRTLQRRIKSWRAVEGPAREVELGGVPNEHRSDRMSAAVNNLIDTREFTRAYEGLLRHYGLTGQKIQAGEAHENGDIEQRHYRFKQAADQALMMRGSRDFATVAAYDQFLRKLFAKMNATRRERVAEELSQLRPLPAWRLDSMRRERVRVSPGSLIHVHRNTYSVHSRLIGEMVEARIKSESVEVWYGDRKVKELPRLRGRSKHGIDYRHIIDWLVRKPGAFEHYRYREDLFPTSWFRLAYDALREEHGPKRGAKEYLQILALAAKRGESLVEDGVRLLLGRRDPLNAAAVAHLTEPGAPSPLLTVEVATVSVAVFV